MNIERSKTRRGGQAGSEISERREALYRTIPNWRALLAAVRAGEAEFVDALDGLGLLQKYGKATSTVHAYDDIEGHAFILGIVSEDRWDEVQTKSYLTYASHWIDDFFDCPELVANPAQLMDDRHDIRDALANMGLPGRVGFAMANRVPHPAGVYKALHRMLYGGLVQRSEDRAQRRALMREYAEVAARFVAPSLVREIRTLQPEAYWASNKTVLEFLNAAEKELDFTASELWNLVYAPALFYQDADEEGANGELNFDAEESPRLPEMVRMIRIAGKYLLPAYSADSPQMRQLKFLALSFQNLPNEVLREYQSMWEGGRAQTRASPPRAASAKRPGGASIADSMKSRSMRPFQWSQGLPGDNENLHKAIGRAWIWIAMDKRAKALCPSAARWSPRPCRMYPWLSDLFPSGTQNAVGSVSPMLQASRSEGKIADLWMIFKSYLPWHAPCSRVRPDQTVRGASERGNYSIRLGRGIPADQRFRRWAHLSRCRGDAADQRGGCGQGLPAGLRSMQKSHGTHRRGNRGRQHRRCIRILRRLLS